MAIIAIIAVVAVVAIMAAIAKDSANQISKVGILPNAVRTLLSYHLAPAQLPFGPCSVTNTRLNSSREIRLG